MLRAAVCWVVLATSVAAQSANPRVVGDAFAVWAEQEGIRGAEIAVFQDGKATLTRREGWGPYRLVELASLSKAITGICVAQLVARGDLSWDALVPDVLNTGPQVTVAELMTHTSGIGPDDTQGTRGVAGVMRGVPADQVAGRALARTPQQGTRGTYHYNNENYAILALIIERVAGDYQSICKALALDPAGVEQAQASPKLGPSLAWGGWQMAVVDYARFHDHWFGQDAAFDVHSVPAAQVNETTSYGPGVLIQNGVRFHFGSVCVPFYLNAGAFVITWNDKMTVTMAYDACLSTAQTRSLNDAIVAALRAR